MRVDVPGRHLESDEIADRVFPSGEGPIPVPLHLAACPECQEKVETLREGWLLDRGAVAGVVDATPPQFWKAQKDAVMEAVTGVGVGSVRPFPCPPGRAFFRRPVVALSSLAAAILLVTGLSLLRSRAPEIKVEVKPTPVADVGLAAADRKDDELLRSIDRMLSEDQPFSSLVPEGV